jgi:hypothetical protein
VIASAMTEDLARKRPFSDSAMIRDRAEQRTLRWLELVLRATGRSEPVGEDVRALVDSDPIVRNVVASLGTQLEARGRLSAGAAEIATELVGALSAHPGSGRLPGGFAEGLHYADGTGARRTVSLWRTRSESDPVSAWFMARLTAKIAAPQAPADFTADQIAAVEAGLSLLLASIPDVAASMLPHVQLLCRLAAPPDAVNLVLSGSYRDVPGVVFLADPLLSDPLTVAEHVLHEACHQRYGELSRAASMLCEGYDDERGSKIAVPWHRTTAPSSLWGIDKALTAGHVYLYLTYFFAALCEAPPPALRVEESTLRRRLHSSYDRGRYLLRALDDVGRPVLGYAGNALLDWMLAAFAAFGLADDGRARVTRLVLERHEEEEREFRVLAAAVAALDPAAGDERFAAFMAWLDGLEPAISQRFEKMLTAPGARAEAPTGDDPPPALASPAHAPLARYAAARRRRARTILDLLALDSAELAAATDPRAALAFAQAESAALDRFADPAFRDRLEREWALRAGR